jgi:hypothetical protein
MKQQINIKKDNLFINFFVKSGIGKSKNIIAQNPGSLNRETARRLGFVARRHRKIAFRHRIRFTVT